jgi:hypothetical protein
MFLGLRVGETISLPSVIRVSAKCGERLDASRAYEPVAGMALPFIMTWMVGSTWVPGEQNADSRKLFPMRTRSLARNCKPVSVL